jgi:unsaturated rhamnogalacturonyl hydrolase
MPPSPSTGFPEAESAAEFRDWPAGASPLEIGARVAAEFADAPFEHPDRPLHYAEVCTWYGALTFAARAGDPDLRERLIRKYDPLLQAEGSPRISTEAHVDHRVFGAVPLEIYRQTGDPRYLAPGKRLADAQWASPTPDGITAEARCWIDDMYMITLLQTQAARATGNPEYTDRAARAMAAYLDRLQQPNGLFVHAPDAPFYWSRGNGWMAAGAAELLRALPDPHPLRPRILAGFRRMTAALVPLQGADGMWRQLLDRPQAWPESSGTGMFAFAFVTGVQRGWLEREPFAAAARRAWLGLAARIDGGGRVTDVCAGTPKGHTAAYYLGRPRVTGDRHGQAPILWCASAFLRPQSAAPEGRPA